ncbi:MAG: hypothetical protein R8G34_15500 [Paracoccaceae bacterium]|nr:hypothetical protein [Paracoccaceae bacterium]
MDANDGVAISGYSVPERRTEGRKATGSSLEAAGSRGMDGGNLGLPDPVKVVSRNRLGESVIASGGPETQVLSVAPTGARVLPRNGAREIKPRDITPDRNVARSLVTTRLEPSGVASLRISGQAPWPTLAQEHTAMVSVPERAGVAPKARPLRETLVRSEVVTATRTRHDPVPAGWPPSAKASNVPPKTAIALPENLGQSYAMAPRPARSPAAPARIPTSKARPMTAAWSGTQALDSRSLDALADFAAPRLAGAARPRTQGQLSDLLSALPCARAQVEYRAETGRMELRGHIPTEDLRAPMMAGLADIVGASIPIDDTLALLPEPQCGVLGALEDLGIALSNEQGVSPRMVGPTGQARVFTFRRGDLLNLVVTGSDYPAKLMIDYYDAAGMVTHLVPNDVFPPLALATDENLELTGPIAAGRFPRVRISPPYGSELAVVIASSAVLSDGSRGRRETAGLYLEWLKRQIAEARATDPDFRAEWAYFIVETRE